MYGMYILLKYNCTYYTEYVLALFMFLVLLKISVVGSYRFSLLKRFYCCLFAL